MKGFVFHWLSIVLALAVTAYLLPGIHIQSAAALLIAGLVLGLLNAVVRPVLVILTLPITFLTLGLFYLVVNGFVFSLAACLAPGFSSDSIWWSMLGALVVGFVSWIVGGVLGSGERPAPSRD